jgi:hypothetical protein
VQNMVDMETNHFLIGRLGIMFGQYLLCL